MRLLELDPKLITGTEDEESGNLKYQHTQDEAGNPIALERAMGVRFLCPKCFVANNGKVGTHSVVCWFNGSGVPDYWSPGPGRWNVAGGSGVDDLTLTPSIQLHAACAWHGFITNGEVTS